MNKCMFCGKNFKKNMLYEVKKEGELIEEYICEDCLEEHDEYDICSVCISQNKRYVYPKDELDDDEHCPEHHDDDWSDDMEDFLEYHFNH